MSKMNIINNASANLVVDTTIVAGTNITSTAGNITASAGNFNLPATTVGLTEGVINSDGRPVFQLYGVDNLFIGPLCGNSTLNVGIAEVNIAIGVNCMPVLDTGGENCVVGMGAAALLTTGNLNHLFGLQCGGSLVGGSHNTMMGQQSGLFVTSGSYNMMIGTFQTGINCTSSESSNIYLQNPGVTSESNVMRLGDTGSGNAQVSSAYIAGVYGVTPGGSGIQVVTMDSNGQMGTGSGALSIDAINLPVTNSALTQGVINVGGVTTFQFYGTQNMFLGQGCGNGTLNTGSAQSNVALGFNCLPALTDGDGNLAVGDAAGEAITTGNLNNLFGLEAGFSLVGGSHNCLIGQQPGIFITSGSYNTMLGAYQVGVNCTGGESSNIYIQNPGVTSESNAIRIGEAGSGDHQQNICYIAGIYGVTPGLGNDGMVIIDTNGNLGSQLALRMPQNPAFSVYNSANSTNQTGNGAVATVNFNTSLLDQTSSFSGTTFTAPVTGAYRFEATVTMSNFTIATTSYIQLVTTANTFYGTQCAPLSSVGASGRMTLHVAVMVPMTASDTAMIQVVATGEAANTNTVNGSSSPYFTYFSGSLVS